VKPFRIQGETDTIPQDGTQTPVSFI